MSRNNSVSAPIQITESEEAILRKIGTNGSDLGRIEEDPEHPLHKQDWNVKTEAKDSWANKEIRRTSIWSKIDENNPHHVVQNSPTERRGSVLSIWRAGKDKDGRSILIHDGDTHETSSSEEEVVEKEEDLSPKLSPRERRLSDRRGSILSLWSNGKDEKGRDVIAHDDEEWKI